MPGKKELLKYIMNDQALWKDLKLFMDHDENAGTRKLTQKIYQRL